MFTLVKASDVYPKPSCIKDSETLFPPSTLPLLPGEALTYLGSTRFGGLLSLTNYRLHINFPSSSFVNVPLGLIDVVEHRDLYYLYIYCKDARFFQFSFESTGSAEEWHKRLLSFKEPLGKLNEVFAFAHFAWGTEMDFEVIEKKTRRDTSHWFSSEISRLRFDVQGAWRISTANKDYKLCGTYPEELLIPFCISDAMLEKIAQFRSARRVPAVLWRHGVSGAVLARCSQPEVGWLGWRSSEDEQMVKAISDACSYDKGPSNDSCIALDSEISSFSSSSLSSSTSASSSLEEEEEEEKELQNPSKKSPKKVLIIDARSYAAAVGNRARGGGVECPEYYPNTEIVFMSLANIHSIRKSFQALRGLLNSGSVDQSSWFGALDSTKWLSHMSGLLKAALRCTTALEIEGRPVLVHCSDGWDRTPQIVSLSQLLLDPYYRTIEGFQILVEKEWLDFGHKMADRCGTGVCANDPNERSPIFLQWLDVVHQLLLQFPTYFEFNHSYLLKLVSHTYSGLFGTFLGNSQQERRKAGVNEKTRSIWSYLKSYPFKFKNFLYSPQMESLWPRSDIKDLALWKDVYFSSIDIEGFKSNYESETNSTEGSDNGAQDPLVKVDSSVNDKALKHQERQRQRNRSGPILPAQTISLIPNPSFESSTDTLVPESEKRKSKKSVKKRESHEESSIKIPIEPLTKSHFEGVETFTDPLDSDGLVSHVDEVHKRLVDIMTSHRAEISALKRDLYLTRRALCNSTKSNDGRSLVNHYPSPSSTLPSESELHDKLYHNDVETPNGGSSGVESTTSELSWEAVDEKETKPTLWVPDHAASSCMGCKTKFWFGRRKHHCRNCGRLYCSDCSDHMAPIPTEQLYHPVRVCDECYEVLKDFNTEELPSYNNDDDEPDDGNENRREEKTESFI